MKIPTQNFLMFFCVADVDAEERVVDSLVENLKLKFGKDLEFFFIGQHLEPEVWSRFGS